MLKKEASTLDCDELWHFDTVVCEPTTHGKVANQFPVVKGGGEILAIRQKNSFIMLKRTCLLDIPNRYETI